MQPTRTQCGPHFGVPIWSCSKWGLPCRIMLPCTRCALTAPFHPYQPKHKMFCSQSSAREPIIEMCWRFIFCCTFRRLSPPRRYLALCPMEPGLSSAEAILPPRLPSQLPQQRYRLAETNASIKSKVSYLLVHVILTGQSDEGQESDF